VFKELRCDDYRAYITGRRNYRNEIAVTAPYKGNRKDNAKPKHYVAIRKHLQRLGAELIEDQEADDSVAIDATASGGWIVSIDKDLDQVAGWHYNFVKKEMVKITQDEGFKRFYLQVLTGDRTDNVFGLSGIGPVKAGKILEGLLPEEYYGACRAAYNDDERLHKNCKLLWVLREANQVWEPPKDYVKKEESKEEISQQEAPIQV
jgi:5'-3' exonuclease